VFTCRHLESRIWTICCHTFAIR